jgi:DNA repair exonuclease SbcCD nuclease subunit
MKILLIGDIHMKLKLREKILPIFDDIYNIIENNNFDFVVLLGDLLDGHNKVDLLSFIEIENFLIKISLITKLFVIIGNHDRPNNTVYLNNEHAFNSFKYINNITIVDDVLDYGEFLFVPYVPVGRFSEAISQKINQNHKYIFCHQEFNGASLIKNIISKNGDIIPENITIISGHIHNHQILNEERLIYLGSILPINRGEDENKFILILENYEMNFKEIRKDEKIKIEIDAKKLYDLKLEENKKYEIIISGEKTELKEIIKNNRFDNITIIPKIKNGNINFKNENFESTLKEYIKNNGDKNLEEFFEIVFGITKKIIFKIIPKS